jgi:AraC-like DNA-binding protein
MKNIDTDCFLQRYSEMPDPDFPVHIASHHKTVAGFIFDIHLHQHLQFIYFAKGEALIYCNFRPIHANAGDILAINIDELHYGENIGKILDYYIIRIDPSFLLSSSLDSCQAKYISPLLRHRLLFKNDIGCDKEVQELIHKMIVEYSERQPGFELVVKACVYNLIVALIRKHTEKTLSDTEYETQKKNIEFFRNILDYIQENYNEKIDVTMLSRKANMSYSYFCRVFKKTTGNSPLEYINRLRINRAVELMKESCRNISEIAICVGFSDTNYFSRVFKQIKKASPTRFRKSVDKDTLHQTNK